MIPRSMKIFQEQNRRHPSENASERHPDRHHPWLPCIHNNSSSSLARPECNRTGCRLEQEECQEECKDQVVCKDRIQVCRGPCNQEVCNQVHRLEYRGVCKAMGMEVRIWYRKDLYHSRAQCLQARLECNKEDQGQDMDPECNLLWVAGRQV